MRLHSTNALRCSWMSRTDKLRSLARGLIFRARARNMSQSLEISLNAAVKFGEHVDFFDCTSEADYADLKHVDWLRQAVAYRWTLDICLSR